MTAPEREGITAIVIAIGNGDNRLTQQEWSDFWIDCHDHIDGIANYAGVELHGVWVSPSTAPWQNAAWALSFDDDMLVHSRQLKLDLMQVLRKYRQDSMAWTTGCTELIPAATEEAPE